MTNVFVKIPSSTLMCRHVPEFVHDWIEHTRRHGNVARRGFTGHRLRPRSEFRLVLARFAFLLSSPIRARATQRSQASAPGTSVEWEISKVVVVVDAVLLAWRAAFMVAMRSLGIANDSRSADELSATTTAGDVQMGLG